MKFSRLFAPTLKDAPKDAVLPSHALLIRAGFIEQTGSGLYNLLPLGKMVLDNIKAIVKDEMDKAGAQEVSFSVVTNADFWRESGRYNVFGKELLRFKDRKENDFVLSPTNEESVVAMVRNRVTSYKNLPINLYQINTKFRDEARPRFGLMRGREFVMKDAYSFHANVDDLGREFDLMEKTYNQIFTRLGLDFRAVEADSGAIGGSGSKEFMLLAQNGEDKIIVCESCSYAANIEAAKRKNAEFDGEIPQFNMQTKFKTPNLSTIDEVADFFHVDKFFTIKAVIKKAIYENGEKIVVFFVRGSDELQETKAQNACKALEITDASVDEIKNAGLVAGFCGPINLPSDVEFFIDSELENERNLIAGANELDYHFIGVSIVNFKQERFCDLISVKQNDRCLKCGGKLALKMGIEVGHIFKLGQKYSSAMSANFLDENGKTQPFFMGCYGIGVSRLIAAIIEANNDERGCIWNKGVAPFDLEIIVSNIKDEAQMKFASEIYESARKLGIKVLFDERNERFGVKMSDFELIGFPFAVLVGKGLANGEVEFISRRNLSKAIVKSDEILDVIKKEFE